MKTITKTICLLTLLCTGHLSTSAGTRENIATMGENIGPKEVKTVLKELDATIAERDNYPKKKEWRVTNLHYEMKRAHNASDSLKIYDRLFEEYKYYQFDSAWCYARKMEKLAIRSADREGMARARAGLLFCYKSVGFFNEANEIIRDFRTEDLPPEMLVNYYLLCAETYLNQSSYVWGISELTHKYDSLKRHYYQMAYQASPEGSFAHELAGLEIELFEHSTDSLSIEARKRLINRHDISEHEEAVQYSILAAAYSCRGYTNEAIYYRALSAISDIISCTRETTSAKVLAEYMYDAGDISRASSYIHQALRDAEAYNSRIRKVEINTVLPVIENARYNWVWNQRTVFLILVIVVTLLLMLSVSLFLKLRSRNTRLAELHQRLEKGAEELSETNRNLCNVNERLNEANEIKDQYIAKSLCGNFGFVNEVEEQTKFAVRKIMAKQYDDVIGLLSNIGIKKERERIYAAFDSAFLKLFPNFIDEFNRLFPEEFKIGLDDNGALPMEVRIFALMRLGIENSAEVAEYLNISVNTLYVYKTKVKSKSSVPKEEFDSMIRAIPKP